MSTALVNACAWCKHLLDDNNNKLPETVDSLPADAVVSHGMCNEDHAAQQAELKRFRERKGSLDGCSRQV